MSDDLTPSAERLYTYVMEGLLPDVFVARESLTLLRTIAEKGDDIRRSTFEPFFEAVDRAVFSQFILAICRMFDPPSARYEIRSIPAALTLIGQSPASLPVRERPGLQQRLRLAGLNIELDALSEEALARASREFFEAQCPTADAQSSDVRSRALDALRARRNKRVAHSEHTAAFIFPALKWGDVEALIRYAEDFLSCYGFGFLGLALTDDDGHFVISESDAERASIALGRLMRRLDGGTGAAPVT